MGGFLSASTPLVQLHLVLGYDNLNVTINVFFRRSYRRSYNHHHGEGGRRRRHGGERDRRERGYDSRTDLEESMNTRLGLLT